MAEDGGICEVSSTINDSEPPSPHSKSTESTLVLSVSNLNPDEDSMNSDFRPKSNQSCLSGPLDASDMSKDMVDGSPVKKSATFAQTTVISDEVKSLQGALACLQEKLTTKDMEIAKLSRIREDVEAELEDLTASLFEEAHKMVREANVKQASAEKGLAEAIMKIDGLETEVAALKTLVLTSTPSQPNMHLHPQIDPKVAKEQAKKNKKKVKEKNGSSESITSTTSAKQLNGLENGSASPNFSHHHCSNQNTVKDSEGDVGSSKNIDPLLRKDYLSWKKTPTLDKHHPFLARIYQEDIDLCLRFPNEELTKRVVKAIHENTLCLSPVKDFSNIPRNCALLESPVLCKYTLKLPNLDQEDSEEPLYFVSQLARNRLAAVCDCINYLRYIHQGLVKAHVNDVYWEIMRLRKQMVIARLGFPQE